MNKEKIKNWILIGLVLLSFGFTTQLWLSIPIGQIIPSNQAFSGQDSKEDYDLSSFVLPQWMVVNFGGESHTKLINDSSNHNIFSDIYGEVSKILEYIFANEQDMDFIQVERDDWAAAREGKSIEVQYRGPFHLDIFKKIFAGEKAQGNMPITAIKGITISLGTDRAIYIHDGENEVIYKSQLPVTDTSLDQLVDRLEERDPVKYWTLEEIGYSDNNNFYVPLDMSSFNLPVGTAAKELDTNNHGVLDLQASGFFSDMSLVRKITEMNGSLIYTDGQSALLRIDTNGFLEYMVYSSAGGDKSRADVNSALEAALLFISNHGGIPEQLYLEEIRGVVENDYPGYLLKFNYAYNGLPFFRRSRLETSAVEVTVAEGKVVRYNRYIHQITKARIEQKPLLYPVEAADVVAKAISGSGGAKNLPVISDMYLGYCIDMGEAKNFQAFPVWYIKTEERAYIVDAYQGRLIE